DILQCRNIILSVFRGYGHTDDYAQNAIATDMDDIKKNYLDVKGGHWWVALVDDQIAGQVGVQPLALGDPECYQEESVTPHYSHIHADQICELRRLGVLSKYQKQRIGFKLLQTLIGFAQLNEYKAIHLTTLAQMRSACNFYERCGFISGKVEQHDISLIEQNKIISVKFATFEEPSLLTNDDHRLIQLPIQETHKLYVQHYWMLI
ncbi:unnamed protein product, partial [Didymodactylos carnosus]